LASTARKPVPPPGPCLGVRATVCCVLRPYKGQGQAPRALLPAALRRATTHKHHRTPPEARLPSSTVGRCSIRQTTTLPEQAVTATSFVGRSHTSAASYRREPALGAQPRHGDRESPAAAPLQNPAAPVRLPRG
jgi:hypothetical protein